MSIRPIDMQISIAAMNQANAAHQQVNQVGANAHANVAQIKKDQVQKKETVQDPNDSRRIKAPVEDDEEKDRQRRKEEAERRQKEEAEKKKKEEEEKNLTEEEKEERAKKEAEEKEKKKRYIYTLGNNGKIELKPEDSEAESEGAGHIDYKA